MANFVPRTFPQILGGMISRITSSTPITDVNFGGVLVTMLEAAAQEDDEQYFQMLEILRGYSIDTVTGTDLDNKAFEYGITRAPAKTASTTVTLGDSAITKVSTGVYSGLPGSVAGSTSINGDGSTGFPASGSIVIGRGTPNVETKPYTSITNNGNYVTFNLGAALAFDHGTDESIVLSQGGNRLVTAGTVVMVPASDLSAQVDFTLDSNATILDGESQLTAVPVTASLPGSSGNVPVGSISQFDSPPFSTATVRNAARVTNGRDVEDDQQLRDRIKDHIQSLSRGTGKSIITGVIGLLSERDSKRVVSAALIEPTLPADVVKLFIDDGTGFIPTLKSVGYEQVVASATGGERFLKIVNVPVVKAFVETQNSAPFALSSGTLFVEVGGTVETITFQSTDFSSPGFGTAQEVLKKLNSVAALFEARISADGNKVRIFARKNQDEAIRVTGGTANTPLNFPTDAKFTTKLYIARNNALMLLSKDGITASIETGLAASYNFSLLHDFALVVDGKARTPEHIWVKPSDFLVPATVTALEAVGVLNASLVGAVAATSSNGTRFRINSNIQRSALSKVRIVETFSKVWNEEASILVDRTDEVKTNASNVTIFGSDLDYLYLGHSDVTFESIFFQLATVASATMTLIFEYWNGSAWTALGVTDKTSGLTQRGFMTFKAPHDWAKVVVNGSAAIYWVRIQRNMAVLATSPIESRIKVCSANEIFGFSESEVLGANKDYTLNRFIGQIELESPLQVNDTVTLGSFDTRAFIVTQAQATYGLAGGELFEILVDGVLQSFSFIAGDFATPGAATAFEVVARINKSILGVVASTVDTNTRVKIRTNKWNSGTLKVNATAANVFLQFPTTQADSLVAHVPAVESGTASPYVFPVSNSVIVIIDGNLANNFTVPLFKQGTLTAASAAVITDSTLSATFPLAADLAGFDVEMIDGPQVGQRRSIASYVPGTGALTLASAFPGSPAIGNKYQIIPVSAVQVVRFWNNKQITLLSTKAEISAGSGGTKVQIASLQAGEVAAVLVSGGNGNAVLNFSTLAKLGVDGYRHFEDLAKITQWTVDGRAGDPLYEGIRAAGVQVEVAEPVTVPIVIELDVTTREGVAISSITNDIKSAVSAYINTLPVGGDVILSEVTVAVKSVAGVLDVRILSPSANIAIADNELPKIKDSDVAIG